MLYVTASLHVSFHRDITFFVLLLLLFGIEFNTLLYFTVKNFHIYILINLTKISVSLFIPMKKPICHLGSLYTLKLKHLTCCKWGNGQSLLSLHYALYSYTMALRCLKPGLNQEPTPSLYLCQFEC